MHKAQNWCQLETLFLNDQRLKTEIILKANTEQVFLLNFIPYNCLLIVMQCQQCHISIITKSTYIQASDTQTGEF